MRYITRILLISVLTTILIATAVPVHSYGAIYTLYIRYDLAVILVGIGADLDRLENLIGVDSVTVRYMPFTVTFEFNITLISMPASYVEKLKRWLAEHYIDLGKPEWVREYEELNNISLKVRWVNLVEFYDYLYTLIEDLDRRHGLRPEDHLVFIGDIDGISRQYISRVRHPEGYGDIVLAGVRGWGGIKPMTFYDLTTIPRPRPEPYMPFAGYGIPTNFYYDPPIWSIRDVEKYIARVVRDHIRFHIVNSYIAYAWYAHKLEVDIYFVDFGNHSKVLDLVSRFNVSYLVDLLRSFAPWVRYSVKVKIINAKDIPGLYDLAKECVRNGWIVFPYEKILFILGKYTVYKLGILGPRGYLENWRYAVYILVTDKPSHMSMWDLFNFTGYSTATYSAISYPGYGYRVPRSSLARCIAHEIGHTFGLQHPFQVFEASESTEDPYRNPENTKWLMDWIASVMSYENAEIAGFDYPPRDYYSMYRLAIVHSLVILNYMTERNIIPSIHIDRVLKLLEEGRCIDAIEYLVKLLEHRLVEVYVIYRYAWNARILSLPIPR